MSCRQNSPPPTSLCDTLSLGCEPTYHIISIQFLRKISGPPLGTKPELEEKKGKSNKGEQASRSVQL